MGIQTNKLNGTFTDFIESQLVFFVATAATKGKVNVSPKGLSSLRVINDREIVWLSVTGSGNETAAHVLENPRMTLMFCAFEGDHMILRVYGSAELIYPHHADWNHLYELFPEYAGARNIFKLAIDTVTTSCGSGVPEMKIIRSRAETDLVPWYAEMGEKKLKSFWQKKNTVSLDGLPTGIFDSSPK